MAEGKSGNSSAVASGLAVVLGAAIAWLTRGTSGVHLPLLAAALAGIVIGLADSRRGWIAAVIQSVVVAAGVLFIGREGAVPEIEKHSLFGAIGLSFAGSFIGAFIKRAFRS